MNLLWEKKTLFNSSVSLGVKRPESHGPSKTKGSRRQLTSPAAASGCCREACDCKEQAHHLHRSA